ncbi:hypothetical protein BSLG_002904 [Batrachochytrium salamandrivorans]|nr:hypothetical protein BSLG_002904 [Batrachochytrium salamandrivorans]
MGLASQTMTFGIQHCQKHSQEYQQRLHPLIVNQQLCRDMGITDGRFIRPTQAYTSKVHGKFIQMDSLDAELVAGYAERQRIQKLSTHTIPHPPCDQVQSSPAKALGMMDIPKENLR